MIYSIEPCKTSSFLMGVNSVNKQSSIGFDNVEDYRYIDISYSKTIVTVKTISKLIDFPTFISSVGGNLGLFVGFSFINVLFFFYELTETKISGK